MLVGSEPTTHLLTVKYSVFIKKICENQNEKWYIAGYFDFFNDTKKPLFMQPAAFNDGGERGIRTRADI